MGYKQIICPCCGRAVGMYHQEKEKIPGKSYYHRTEESVPYLDWLQENYSLSRDYFAVEQQHKDGRLREGQPLRPEDWPQGFWNIKQALFRAIRHYRKQGWLELTEIIEKTK